MKRENTSFIRSECSTDQFVSCGLPLPTQSQEELMMSKKKKKCCKKFEKKGKKACKSCPLNCSALNDNLVLMNAYL